MVGDHAGEIDGWEIDDGEAKREVRGVEELNLGDGSFGGDVEEGHVTAMEEDEALSELEERDHVTHTRA